MKSQLQNFLNDCDAIMAGVCDHLSRHELELLQHKLTGAAYRVQTIRYMLPIKAKATLPCPAPKTATKPVRAGKLPVLTEAAKEIILQGPTKAALAARKSICEGFDGN